MQEDVIYHCDFIQHAALHECWTSRYPSVAANGNGAAAQKLHTEWFPNREILNQQTFEQVHRQLHKSWSFNASRLQWASLTHLARTVWVEDDVLHEVEHNPSTSMRVVSHRQLICEKLLVWEILHGKGMLPYNFSKAAGINANRFSSPYKLFMIFATGCCRVWLHFICAIYGWGNSHLRCI